MEPVICSKTYSEVPFAHRQWRHEGHCSRIHGHNWSIEVVFQCESLDENGFVVDFGNLKFLRDWIDENLDHACLLSEDDPEMDRFEQMQNDNLIQITTVNNASCEGIAKHIFDVFDEMIRSKTSQRAWVCRIELYEDSNNKVSYSKPS